MTLSPGDYAMASRMLDAQWSKMSPVALQAAGWTEAESLWFHFADHNPAVGEAQARTGVSGWVQTGEPTPGLEAAVAAHEAGIVTGLARELRAD